MRRRVAGGERTEVVPNDQIIGVRAIVPSGFVARRIRFRGLATETRGWC